MSQEYCTNHDGRCTLSSEGFRDSGLRRYRMQGEWQSTYPIWPAARQDLWVADCPYAQPRR